MRYSGAVILHCTSILVVIIEMGSKASARHWLPVVAIYTAGLDLIEDMISPLPESNCVL